MYRYFMTQRPPMPGAQPKLGLCSIEDLDKNVQISSLGKGAYAILTYSRPLTKKEMVDYELTPCADKDGLKEE